MSLTDKINAGIKESMLAKDKNRLVALRAVKSELILAATSSANHEVGEETEIKILQKLVKQRNEAATIYKEQNREDLEKEELEQVKYIEPFLPKQMAAGDVATVVSEIIAKVGASSPQDMGRVMGACMKALAGKADGNTISGIVKRMLAK